MVELSDLTTVRVPNSGIVRIGRAPDPLALPVPLSFAELDQPHVGSRFDSALGEYSVLYFGSKLQCCFAETLSRFRPDPAILAAIGKDWPDRFMQIGAVPADWRTKRLAVTVTVPAKAVFVDVEDAKTRAVLRREMAEVLAIYGADDLDVATVRGPDRRITRAISQWVWDFAVARMEPIAGLRYLSRLNTKWEAWAVFGSTPLTETSREPIGPEMPDLKTIARLYELVVH